MVYKQFRADAVEQILALEKKEKCKKRDRQPFSFAPWSWYKP